MWNCPNQQAFRKEKGSIVASTDAATADDLGTTLTINKPAGVVDGDLLVFFGVFKDNRTWTLPGGWTQRAVNTTNKPAMVVATKTASSEGADYTFTASSATGIAGVIVALRKYAFDVVGSIASTASDTNDVVANSITLSEDDSLILACGGSAKSTSINWDTPSGFTLQDSNDQEDAVLPNLSVFYKEAVASGATGTLTIPVTASASERKDGVQIAFSQA